MSGPTPQITFEVIGGFKTHSVSLQRVTRDKGYPKDPVTLSLA